MNCTLSVCAIFKDPKMGPFWGPRIPRFDAVFNKTASLTQSLYARARIGIVCRVQNTPKMGPFRTPYATPGPIRYLNTAKIRGSRIPSKHPKWGYSSCLSKPVIPPSWANIVVFTTGNQLIYTLPSQYTYVHTDTYLLIYCPARCIHHLSNS